MAVLNIADGRFYRVPALKHPVSGQMGTASCSVLAGSSTCVHVQCQYRVTLRAGFVRGGIPVAWNVWSLNRKSPGTSATFPSLGLSVICTSLSSNSSSGLKLLPIILAPKVIPEILSEHRQTVFCRLSPQVIAFQSVCGSFRPVRSGALNI